ncbi:MULTISPECIES: D-ribose pyranase [Cobetia]|uniref:D-ribose pyranase n=1 Tax=Cobetia TaxID=204286 RepID=UPI003132B048
MNQRIQTLDRLIPALPKDCDVKRHGILNGPLSGHLARLGHTHTVVIADAGLPIPEGVPCVDLAVVPGLPAMLPVLDALLAELCIEATTLAEELPVKSPSFHDAIVERLDTLDRLSLAPIARQQLSHEAFKAALPEASVIVRTGECTPYANVILHCGVPF